MSNLRQIGMATQLYMNDNSGVVFSTTTPPTPWMTQLNPKYFAAWRGLQSPFDKRPASEGGPTPPPGTAVSPISYGINQNIFAQSADKITKPAAFIMFAPAQASGTTVSFAGLATTAAPGVLVNSDGDHPAMSSPGGTATGGTHNSRLKINALFADWHAETMPWSGTGPAFTNNTQTGTDPDGHYRWYLQ
jgi:prepilin-type processing-associated H-X9-DG protein